MYVFVMTAEMVNVPLADEEDLKNMLSVPMEVAIKNIDKNFYVENVIKNVNHLTIFTDVVA